MQQEKLLYSLCGLQGTEPYSFKSNIIIEFISDDEDFYTGFYAEVYTMSKWIYFKNLWIMNFNTFCLKFYAGIWKKCKLKFSYGYNNM